MTVWNVLMKVNMRYFLYRMHTLVCDIRCMHIPFLLILGAKEDWYREVIFYIITNNLNVNK